MSITINNMDQLLAFLKVNYKNLSDEQFNTIVKETMSVWTDGKFQTYETAEEKLLQFYFTWIDKPNHEKPLFLESDI